MKPRLLSIRQSVELVARFFGEEDLTQRQAGDRLNELDRASGGRIITTLHGRRGRGCKRWVVIGALASEIASRESAVDGDVSRIRADLEGLARKLRHLRKDHQALDSAVAKFRNRQEAINNANSRAITAIKELQDALRVHES